MSVFWFYTVFNSTLNLSYETAALQSKPTRMTVKRTFMDESTLSQYDLYEWDTHRVKEWRINMGRPAEKSDLLTAAAVNFEKLNQLISSLTEAERTTPFDFSGDEKKKENHWKRDKNLRDIYIHLYEWHQLLLRWISANETGDPKPFIPRPYTWKTYGDLNTAFWKKHQNTTLEDAQDLFYKSHEEVLHLAEHYSNEELFTKGMYKWVGGSTLGSYFVSTTSSHYDWATKKLKAHKKNCKNQTA